MKHLKYLIPALVMVFAAHGYCRADDLEDSLSAIDQAGVKNATAGDPLQALEITVGPSHGVFVDQIELYVIGVVVDDRSRSTTIENLINQAGTEGVSGYTNLAAACSGLSTSMIHLQDAGDYILDDNWPSSQVSAFTAELAALAAADDTDDAASDFVAFDSTVSSLVGEILLWLSP